MKYNRTNKEFQGIEPDLFDLKPGEKRTIAFFSREIFEMQIHWLEGKGKSNSLKPYKCRGEGCPACRAGEPAMASRFVPVFAFKENRIRSLNLPLEVLNTVGKKLFSHVNGKACKCTISNRSTKDQDSWHLCLEEVLTLKGKAKKMADRFEKLPRKTVGNWMVNSLAGIIVSDDEVAMAKKRAAKTKQ